MEKVTEFLKEKVKIDEKVSESIKIMNDLKLEVKKLREEVNVKWWKFW